MGGERKKEKDFIGFIGFNSPDFNAAFTPRLEIGWRLKKDAWGYGYATDGAYCCLDFGFKAKNFQKYIHLHQHLMFVP